MQRPNGQGSARQAGAGEGNGGSNGLTSTIASTLLTLVPALPVRVPGPVTTLIPVAPISREWTKQLRHGGRIGSRTDWDVGCDGTVSTDHGVDFFYLRVQ